MDLSGHTLLFAEEFDAAPAIGSAVGSGGWRTRYHYGDQFLHSEQQVYVDASDGVDPFSVADGALTITARPAPLDLDLPDDFRHDVDDAWTSGLLTTASLFSFQYGYVEVSAQMPAGQGLWPAIWLLESGGQWPGEYDIVEVRGHDTATTHATTHFVDEDGRNAIDHASSRGFDSADGFHTYGFDWTADTVTWYFDGQIVHQAPNTVDDQTMYLLINLAVGGDWPGAPDETTPEAAEMRIDYVRVYAAPADHAAAPLPAGWDEIGLDAFSTLDVGAFDRLDWVTARGTWDYRTVLADEYTAVRMMSDWTHVVVGNGADNFLDGAAGLYNELDGAGGDDVYRGNGGLDVFVVRDGDGNDRILDFSNEAGNTDKLRLEGFHFTHFDDLAPFAQDTDAGVLLRLDADQAVLIEGVRVDELTPEQFVFADSVEPPAPAEPPEPVEPLEMTMRMECVFEAFDVV